MPGDDSYSRLDALIDHVDPGLRAGPIPNEERLTRGELCDEMGLDVEEVYHYAVQLFSDHLNTHQAAVNPLQVAVVETFFSGLMLGRQVGREEVS